LTGRPDETAYYHGMSETERLARPEDASQAVARQIQQLVTSEALSPGDRIGREEDLAERFGVSRPTLREALRILSSANLVQALKGPGGGVFVAAMPEDALAMSVSTLIGSMIRSESIGIEELLGTRMMLEVPLAGLAAVRASPQNIASLGSLVDELEAVIDDLEQFGKLEEQVHRRVAELAGNRVALALTAWIADVLVPTVHDRVGSAMVESVIVDQLRELVAAIGRADVAAAETAMRTHLVYAMDLVSVVSSVSGSVAGLSDSG
jgi:GntR family transcriptional repressor for pyruvate dehydrogenase complex